MAQNTVKYRMVVIGGSAGSLEVILPLVSLLPLRSHVVFVIVIHRKNDSDSLLASLLAARTALTVREVEDKEPMQTDTIYIAPPDYHLLLENDSFFSLDVSEKIHHSRPSIDVTFESAAEVFGEKVVAVLLSGANADGAEGMERIKARGGLTIVQDPATAEVDYMPIQAIRKNVVDRILPAQEIPGFLCALLDQQST
ncbi:MAG: chemotaxis protein CheB [Flavisolibacter sp.]